MINSSLKEKYWDSAIDKQMVISVVGTNQKIDNYGDKDICLYGKNT